MVSSGRDTWSWPEKAPSCAKAMNEGTSLMTVARALTTPVVKFSCTLASSALMLASWIVWESSVPAGQIALATPGACCSAVTRTVTPAFVAADTPSPMPGMNASPAVRAVKRSVRSKRVCCFGSTALMMG